MWDNCYDLTNTKTKGSVWKQLLLNSESYVRPWGRFHVLKTVCGGDLESARWYMRNARIIFPHFELDECEFCCHEEGKKLGIKREIQMMNVNLEYSPPKF